ncbi:Nramp family divalent metal transporter [Actinoallomurus soli]|uniref:Nramp family divalent metal transporter n=1 Tax=Actinoallomurus soli TaxID=2952535 RepID=UPI002093865B|nr:Nramp family divalent metal transporter [Actinoallomurus soli]MCO5967176.1 Nramp family divalent metal transporter [Actinoallomurus soli]
MLDPREYQDTPAEAAPAATVDLSRSGPSLTGPPPPVAVTTTVRPLIDGTGPFRPAQRLRRLAGLCGPAFVVSVAYVDPGNFATNMSGGARYGYLLLWVIALANLLAMFVQALSAKLGIATGSSLPELCRDHLPKPLVRVLWVQGELVTVATDLAEFLGGAIALNLLFGMALVPAAAITGAVSLVLLALAPRGRHRFEAVIGGLLAVILAGFVYQALRAGSPVRAVQGLVPRLAGTDSLLLATGMVGATVMPHVIYLHSALTREHGATGGRRLALRSSRMDTAVALGVAGLVNMAMLAVAAAVFHGSSDPDGLQAVHGGLGRLIGPGAALAFALALLASGLASSSVGTYAGQIIMAGFLRRRVPILARRLATMAPAFLILAVGIDPTHALILSQVALSFGIPFALIPLVVLTSRRTLMGDLVNRRATIAAGVGVAALISGLNVLLLAQTLTG